MGLKDFGIFMNVNILCVGKLKEKYWRDAASEYTKRLGRFCRLLVTELPESKTDDPNEESKALLANIRKGTYVIALDIGGIRLSSEGLAKKMSELAVNGTSDICFIIGGSNGFNDEVRKAADLRLSFSDFTLPHQLMRIVLMEQIYRSFKINAGEKYHK